MKATLAFAGGAVVAALVGWELPRTPYGRLLELTVFWLAFYPAARLTWLRGEEWRYWVVGLIVLPIAMAIFLLRPFVPAMVRELLTVAVAVTAVISLLRRRARSL